MRFSPVDDERSEPRPRLNLAPTLFVPADVPAFDRVQEYAQTAPHTDCVYEAKHICVDGRIVAGYWVWPQVWAQLRAVGASQ